MAGGGDVTQLLDAFKAGDQEAFERLVPIVYQDPPHCPCSS